ncbi:PEP-CTERM sorting domain-containing protein [Lusitaniella coriacea LEGE 07157]|uniref:PEP-CTERM sorting domain-containing protein n=1 Tax=Lusitaniella coriacea LEGE 07157 TaxID=945747 RepID=A0A8J7DVR8_9CYAN|nr:PEP-CTERM sorting domain-containing protein [Lusitaniella coriacea]MBE9116004.1 PEP-CTERM sorting domain-containing protein [Lusitaniella coriacea LEGE 07157]
MKSITLKKIALATVGTAIATFAIESKPVQATTFFFSDFPSSVAPSFDFSKGDLDLTVTGQSTNGPRNVFQGLFGLGVKGGRFDSPQIDGFGPDETLLLNFDKKVKILSATFSRVGRNDDFKLLVDGDTLVAADIPGGNSWDLGIRNFNFRQFSPDNKGFQFGFTVTGKNDDYFLKKVKVKTVPEPATALGLLSVGALGVISRRKRQQKG